MPKGGRVTDVSSTANNAGVLARAKDAARYLIAGVTPAGWMSPGQPLQPILPGSDPRQWDYPVGINYTVPARPYEPGVFERLRGLSDNCGIVRLAIETRKDQMEALDWQIKPRVDEDADADDGRIKDIQAFFNSPDQVVDWNTWLRSVLEELFVTDTVAIYKRRDKKGRLYGLEQIDGTTIALKFGMDGRLPLSPSPAYQQIIKGLPTTDYTVEELIYAPRNARIHKPYGFSPVEQIEMEINISIRRSVHQLGYYTDGNLTDGIFWLPPEWTGDQVAAFQKWWDSLHSGNLQERRIAKFIPGNKDSYQQVVQPPLKDLYDEWLARVVCFAFSISPEALISKMNRATAETSHDAALSEGLAPLQKYIKRMMDKIIAEEFDAPDLEFSWIDDTEADPLVAEQVMDLRLRNGSITLNEKRAKDGEDPYDGVGDIPGIITMSGFVAIPTEEQLEAKEQASIDGANNAQDAFNNQSGQESDGKAPDDKSTGKDGAQKLKKNSAAIPLNRAVVQHAQNTIHKALTPILKHVARDVSAQLGLAFSKLAKSDDDADDVVDDLDLSRLDDVGPAVQSQIELVAADSAHLGVASVGIADGGVFNQVNDRAVAWAKDRSAQLVSGVTDTTRQMIRDTINQGLADNIGLDQIAQDIGDTYAFSDERSQLIATTEVANANSQGALQGYKQAATLGLNIKKEWIIDAEACPICKANADDGLIDLNEQFSSGDDAPTAHPSCECTIAATVVDTVSE